MDLTGPGLQVRLTSSIHPCYSSQDDLFMIRRPFEDLDYPVAGLERPVPPPVKRKCLGTAKSFYLLLRDEADHTRVLLMQEPLRKPAQRINLILAPCNPKADATFLTLESDECSPMSGANTICAATVLLEAGMLEMKETITGLILEVVAGVIEVTAKCENGTVKTMASENVLAFVYALDHKANIPGLQVVSVDVALGGMHYVLVDAVSVDLAIKHKHGPEMVRFGTLINAAVIESLEPVHLENNKMRGFTILEWTKPLQTGAKGIKVAKNPIV